MHISGVGEDAITTPACVGIVRYRTHNLRRQMAFLFIF